MAGEPVRIGGGGGGGEHTNRSLADMPFLKWRTDPQLICMLVWGSFAIYNCVVRLIAVLHHIICHYRILTSTMCVRVPQVMLRGRRVSLASKEHHVVSSSTDSSFVRVGGKLARISKFLNHECLSIPHHFAIVDVLGEVKFEKDSECHFVKCPGDSEERLAVLTTALGRPLVTAVEPACPDCIWVLDWWNVHLLCTFNLRCTAAHTLTLLFTFFST